MVQDPCRLGPATAALVLPLPSPARYRIDRGRRIWEYCQPRAFSALPLSTRRFWAEVRACASRIGRFSKVLSAAPLHSKCIRALSCGNVCRALQARARQEEADSRTRSLGCLDIAPPAFPPPPRCMHVLVYTPTHTHTYIHSYIHTYIPRSREQARFLTTLLECDVHPISHSQ